MARVKERRRRQRIDVGLPIKIEYDKVKILTKTKNISVLGTYLQTDKEVPIGTTLDLRIKIPKTGPAKSGKSKQLSCRAIAFRCQPIVSLESKNRYGIGIFFRTFLRNGEKDLAKYIDYILAREKKIGKIFMDERRRKLLKQKGGKS